MQLFETAKLIVKHTEVKTILTVYIFEVWQRPDAGLLLSMCAKALLTADN